MKNNTSTFAVLAKRVANQNLDDWLPNHAVIISENLITDVIPTKSLPSESSNLKIYDLGEVSLLPGLIDAHCHMHCSATPNASNLALTETNNQLISRATNNMRKAVLAGTTTVRDLGSKNEVAFTVKQMIDLGHIPGPKLIVSGTPITITAGHCWFFGTEADSEQDVIKAVRNQVKLGAQSIKMMATGGMFTKTSNPRRPQYNTKILKAAVTEAERMGVTIVAHTLSAEGVINCVEAGIHQLIHARWLHHDYSKGLDYRPEVVEKMVAQGQWVDPTIGHHLLAIEHAKKNNTEEQSYHWTTSKVSIGTENHLSLLKKMSESGVQFTTGLDMGMNHADHADSAASAWAFVEMLGWDNWKAIRAATTQTASALGVEKEVGRISKGMKADLASFEGNPANNIRDMHRATSVFKDGKILKLENRVLV